MNNQEVRELLMKHIPLGRLHDFSRCRCYGDEDPALVIRPDGILNDAWYDPYCIAQADRSHREKRQVVSDILEDLSPYLKDT